MVLKLSDSVLIHSCSQVMPFCYDGTNDMFEAQAWDMDQYTKDCQQTWGVTPR